MKLENHNQWSALIGARVEIRHNGVAIRNGAVDDATDDSSVLWIAAEGVQPRTMYEAALGYQAWVKPQELDGTSCFRYRMTTAHLYPFNQAAALSNAR
ncbi:hypothetical protein [Arthrobacter sp. K5]|uniref:Uncharacterized protein n=1 Tax=Arthrobacter sp. K5 TaxID=2839623 RepID=A0AAU8EMR2_9MICC